MSQHTTGERHSVTEPTFTSTVEASTARSAIEAVDAVVDECVVRVTSDGLAVAAQDPATVAYVSLDLPASSFDRYDASDDAIGVDLGRLGSVVGIADRDESVHLELDGRRRTLHVRVGDLSYALGTIDPEAVRSPPENADFSAQFAASATIDGRVFTNAVRAADMVADHVALGVDPDDERLYATAEGDTDVVRIERPADECADFEAGDAHSLFSVSYLDAIGGVVPESDEVELRLGEEAPLCLSFDLATGSVEYVVAPRISRS